MATMIGTEPELKTTLKNLAALEYDTAAAFQSASTRIDPTVGNSKVLELVQRHEKRAQGLAPYIQQLGEQPPRAGDWRQVVTQGKVVLGNLAGQRALFQAIIDNERDVHDAYDQAARRDDIDEELANVLCQYRDDARRQHADLVLRMVRID